MKKFSLDMVYVTIIPRPWILIKGNLQKTAGKIKINQCRF